MNLTYRNGVANISRAQDDAMLAKLNTPTVAMRSNPLDGHDVALYVDGRRISVTYIDITTIAEGAVSILVETALEACLNPDVDATMVMVWGGFAPLETVTYRVAPNEPSGGVFQITSVQLPTQPGGPAHFLGTALTDLHDWSEEGRRIAAAGDECAILTTHVEKL
jgi:hypothetical protein